MLIGKGCRGRRSRGGTRYGSLTGEPSSEQCAVRARDPAVVGVGGTDGVTEPWGPAVIGICGVMEPCWVSPQTKSC